MQLILDTETTIDIKRNMSALNEESLVEKLDVIQELKSDICNSNKENIESQDNIITSDDKELNFDNDKGNIEEISVRKSPEPSENGDTEIVNDKNDISNEDSQQIPIEHPHDIVDQQDFSEPTIDSVGQETSNQEMRGSIKQASSEAIIDVVKQQISSEGTLKKVEQEARSEETLRTVEQEAPSDGTLGTVEHASIEETTSVDDQQAVHVKTFGVDEYKNSNETVDAVDQTASEEKTLDVNDQQVTNEKLLYFVDQQTASENSSGVVHQKNSNEEIIDVDNQQASSEKVLDVDEKTLDVNDQATNEKLLEVDDQQPASENSLGVVDQKIFNEGIIDVDNQQPSSEKALDVDEKTLDVNDQQATNEKLLEVDDQQPASENSLGVFDQKKFNEGIIDVDNPEASSEKTLDVDAQQRYSKETTLDVVQAQTSSEQTLSVFEQACSEGHSHFSRETTLTTVQQQTSEKTLSAVEQQASSEDTLNVDNRKSSSEKTFEVAEQLADSVVTPSVIDQRVPSKESLDKIDDESEKDDDSDPIIISYDTDISTEEKEMLLDEVQEVNSPSKNHVQISDNILSTDDCEPLKEDVEIVELDDEEKEQTIKISLEVEKQKESIETINDDLSTNKPAASMTESDKCTLSHSKNTNTKEIENVCEPMEVDNAENCNTELISEEKKTTVALNEMNNQLDQNDNKDSPQTTTIDITSHGNDTIVNDTEVESVDCKSMSRKEELIKKEENSECKKDIEVNEVVLQEEKSIQNKNETLSSEHSEQGTHKTETQSLGNKLSEDLRNIPSVLKLSNTLDILSDDEDIEPLKNESQSNEVENSAEKQCINIEDDDDIMLIDEDDTNSKDNKDGPVQTEIDINNQTKLDNQTIQKSLDASSVQDNHIQKESCVEEETEKTQAQPITNEKTTEYQTVKADKPLVPSNFLKSYKKNLADMTREDLEEFCIVKIVESIVDRSNLSDIKAKLKTTSQNIEEYKKKAMMLTKQNRDLQVVLKSIQEELKKSPGSAITPLKITRSVGMQVLMTEKPNMKRKVMAVPTQAVNGNNPPVNKSPRTSNPSPRPIKPTPPSQTIPVPRLVPAGNNVVKNVNPITQANVNNSGKAASPLNGVKTTPIPKVAEKRPLNKVQSMTVDLTDDEPPAKVITRSSPVPAPPVRLLHPLAQNSPRKVYIPISGPQGQNIRPGQTIMLKSVPGPGPRPRGPIPTPRLPQNQIRMPRIQNRHPAPLPEVKQYQTNHYKALPPAPDLKLSKVENGIVISWKIEGYQEDSYEEIASYQLYAYQESSSPPSTALWKKIGDVKALPLPMACTLTQFMAGFKYYFAVRAVDVRSRFGPFSLPGSILLLNKI